MEPGGASPGRVRGTRDWCRRRPRCWPGARAGRASCWAGSGRRPAAPPGAQHLHLELRADPVRPAVHVQGEGHRAGRVRQDRAHPYAAGQRVDPQAGHPGGEEPPRGHGLADTGAGVLGHPEPRPSLALHETPVVAVLVGDPAQPGSPPRVQARGQRGAAPVDVALEEIVVPPVEHLHAHHARTRGRDVGELLEAPWFAPGVVEPRQRPVGAGIREPAEERPDLVWVLDLGVVLGEPHVDVAQRRRGPFEATDGGEGARVVGGVGELGEPRPVGGIETAGGAYAAGQSGLTAVGGLPPRGGEGGVVGERRDVQARLAHGGEGARRVTGAVGEQCVVVQIGVYERGAPGQPRYPLGARRRRGPRPGGDQQRAGSGGAHLPAPLSVRRGSRVGPGG